MYIDQIHHAIKY